MLRIRNSSFLTRTVSVLTVVCVVSIGADSALAGEKGIEVKLTEIVDTRRIDLAKNKDENTFNMNEPKLELKFEMQVPSGKKVAEIAQPKKITATDSTGRDLSQLSSQFMNSPQYVMLVMTWDKPPSAFTLQLASPERSATRFNVDTTFDVWVYDSTKEETLSPTTEGSTVDAKIFGMDGVTVRWEKSRNNGINVTILPASLKNHIEEMKLFDGETELESMGTMWNDQLLSYMFRGQFKPTLQAKLKVRKGIEKLPCRVEIKDRALP